MPAEATVAPTPAAPASSPPPPAPSPSPPINVTPAAIDSGPKPPPPKPGSAKERMFQDLRKKVGVAEEAQNEKRTEAKADSVEGAEQILPGGSDGTPEEGISKAPEQEKKGKVSPWKLVDEHKAARLKAEAEIAELRKSMLPPEKVKEITDKAAKLEADYKAAQEELRFTNYSKSDEFKEKYQQPYEESWKRWMGELGELTVDQGGQERPIAPNDLLELVNLPLKEAKSKAMETFGDFADDVMSARKEIRGLFEAQQKALEDARKGGEARVAEQTRRAQESHQKIASQITELWKRSNEMAQADERFGQYFKPVEGDDEVGNRLKKGFEIADAAFSVNSLDPRLSPEQRQQAVQLHAAVRNRAAAFGRLVYQVEKANATIAELNAKLAKYQEAQPGAGEPRREGAPIASSAKESVFQALRKYAH